MMRLGRTARLVLGGGVLVIVFVTLFVVYARQSGEQEQLEGSLAGAQTQLTQLISGRASLESQLTQKESELAQAKALLNSSQTSFPRLEASIEYDEVLSDIADLHNLEIESMSAEEPREMEIEGIFFTVIAFEVGVRGAVNSILGMVNDIAADERFASATVERLEIVVPQAETRGEEPPEPLGRIELSGYSYGGE